MEEQFEGELESVSQVAYAPEGTELFVGTGTGITVSLVSTRQPPY